MTFFDIEIMKTKLFIKTISHKKALIHITYKKLLATMQTKLYFFKINKNSSIASAHSSVNLTNPVIAAKAFSYSGKKLMMYVSITSESILFEK